MGIPYVKLLTAAGVPAGMHDDAINCLKTAEVKARGLTWHKWKVRLFYAGRIAKLLPWAAERLCMVKPEWANMDIEWMRHITCNGDNAPWPGGYPIEGHWRNPDPNSAEYAEAVSYCYWLPGHHPRSREARKAWYRRNGGAYEACTRGIRIVGDPTTMHIWNDNGVEVRHCEGIWQLETRRKVWGFIPFVTAIGYELGNVITKERWPAWIPIEGKPLVAALTWYNLPGRKL